MTPAPDYPNATIDTRFSDQLIPSDRIDYHCTTCRRAVVSMPGLCEACDAERRKARAKAHKVAA